MLKVSLIQMNSQSDKAANIAAALTLLERAVRQDAPDLLVLPEQFDWAGGSPADKLAAAEDFPEGPAYRAIQDFARRHRVWVHAGSLVERAGDGAHTHNTTVVFNRDGTEVARYRKLHLFDVTAPDGTYFRESAVVAPGDAVVTYDLEGLRVGCAICYDLRFPELFQALTAAGARMIVLPSAFTLQTGKDHWEVLCRARAIETQSWFLAPGQYGAYRTPGGVRHSYGHSLVIDPWGHVVARASDGVGIISARIDPEMVERIRGMIPVAAHKRSIFTI